MNAFKPAPAGTRKVNLYILWVHNFPLFQPIDLKVSVSYLTSTLLAALYIGCQDVLFMFG